MKAKNLLDALNKKLGTNSQKDLAIALGVTVQTLVNWRDNDLSPAQVAGVLAKSMKAAVKHSQLQTIRPIVEFYSLDPSESPQGGSWQLFPAGNNATTYAKGLKAQLDKAHGIYVFYDSRGHALYVGKARKQSLWKEMNLAFNRKREVQRITLVKHPDRN